MHLKRQTLFEVHIFGTFARNRARFAQCIVENALTNCCFCDILTYGKMGGFAGTTIGTAVTGMMNNLDPDSANSSTQQILEDAVISGGKAFVTGVVTTFVGYSSNMARDTGGLGFMKTYTYGFGEAVKSFFGWLDDAIVYTEW